MYKCDVCQGGQGGDEEQSASASDSTEEAGLLYQAQKTQCIHLVVLLSMPCIISVSPSYILPNYSSAFLDLDMDGGV